MPLTWFIATMNMRGGMFVYAQETQLQCAMLHSRLLEQLMFLQKLAHTLTRFIAIDQWQTGWRTVYSVRA